MNQKFLVAQTPKSVRQVPMLGILGTGVPSIQMRTFVRLRSEGPFPALTVDALRCRSIFSHPQRTAERSRTADLDMRTWRVINSSEALARWLRHR